MSTKDQPNLNDQEVVAAEQIQPEPVSMEDFFTREEANLGRQMFLQTRDGKSTSEFLIVRGIDSDEYRRVHQRNMRNAIRVASIKDDEERARKISECQTDEIVALVCGWSFKKPFNEHALRDFLMQAPQIAEEVDRFAGNRVRFFSMPPIK